MIRPLIILKSMARNVIGYSAKTFASTQRVHVKNEILSALQGDKGMRKEISRVFQQANRRIQNIEKSGIVSPSLIALNKGDIKGFTKFSMRNDWNTLKMEYAKAVSFLQQPTSTATGAKEYSRHIRETYNLSDKEFKLMQDNLMNKISSVSDERFLEQYLLQYKDFTGELETEARDVSSMIESDAKQLVEAIDKQFDYAAEQGEDAINDVLDEIMRGFEKFGL